MSTQSASSDVDDSVPPDESEVEEADDEDVDDESLDGLFRDSESMQDYLVKAHAQAERGQLDHEAEKFRLAFNKEAHGMRDDGTFPPLPNNSKKHTQIKYDSIIEYARGWSASDNHHENIEFRKGKGKGYKWNDQFEVEAITLPDGSSSHVVRRRVLQNSPMKIKPKPTSKKTKKVPGSLFTRVL
jgi:hypothetical protein